MWRSRTVPRTVMGASSRNPSRATNRSLVTRTWHPSPSRTKFVVSMPAGGVVKVAAIAWSSQRPQVVSSSLPDS